jgi:hypothetical protein
LRQLDQTLASLRARSGVDVFPLNEQVLLKLLELSGLDLGLKPFHQAILAAILVRAEELTFAGEHDLCFREIDADLQTWDKNGLANQPITNLYEACSVWVYGDFDLNTPARPENWLDGIS